METKLLEKIKSWAIVCLFIICFFGFMIFSYQYKSLNEKYEEALKEQVNYQKLIDDLIKINEDNDNTIKELTKEVEVLTVYISDLTKEKDRLLKKIENSQLVMSNNMSVATAILKGNLLNEKL